MCLNIKLLRRRNGCSLYFMLAWESSIQFSYTRFSTLCGVSRRVCGAHLRLLAPWATRLLSQWMLHWWRINVSTARQLFPCTLPLTPSGPGWTGCKHRFSSLRYDLAGNRTRSISFWRRVRNRLYRLPVLKRCCFCLFKIPLCFPENSDELVKFWTIKFPIKHKNFWKHIKYLKSVIFFTRKLNLLQIFQKWYSRSLLPNVSWGCIERVKWSKN